MYKPEKIFISPDLKMDQQLPAFLKKIKDYRIEFSTYNEIPAITNNKRALFVTYFKGGFTKDCPCTDLFVCCKYWTVNNVQGCPYDCSYCILQGYLNNKLITLFVNEGEIFRELAELGKSGKYIRIGTGELGDSLALDHLSGFSERIIPFILNYPNLMFELKTKSANIFNLPVLKENRNVIISWSINPQRIIGEEEEGSASLSDRLASIREVLKRGYLLAFHFDPIFYYKGYKEEYAEVIHLLREAVGDSIKKVKWISLGGLRFTDELKNRVRLRKKISLVHRGEFVKCDDKKWRYPRFIRLEIFNTVLMELKKQGFETNIYLCMEGINIWRKFEGLLDGLKGLNREF